ncbi:hypothetical protein GCM10023214_25350 [Amycolatopsis dongchuanensis]|uniref:PilZ domain-containing protein n=1 Tax=Amycolatopsis dongchuanensis TaxID=1070866 RepID=A0ABP9QF97_9PSEU
MAQADRQAHPARLGRIGCTLTDRWRPRADRRSFVLDLSGNGVRAGWRSAGHAASGQSGAGVAGEGESGQ